mmetsp:Transcript_32042/g.54684  ORF Transcript_32042/g.54684 Transcript_32042/m.54684 type:complete len:147 (+) Transcript_32042:3-443(+)
MSETNAKGACRKGTGINDGIIAVDSNEKEGDAKAQLLGQHNSPKIGTTFTIKIKTEDGGSHHTAESDGSDTFSRLSNRNVRMMHLLNLDEINEDDRDNVEWQPHVGYEGGAAGEDNGNTSRKTMLSTELHPDAHMSHMFANPPEQG